ncbi:MAG: hypothetical protein JWS10_1022 [Cypionkella sp.]|uniref:hypothetical protein n=1 Tax=Cypionkella sp. TaxID=2811411 RepID=UPI002637E123|nr:hypothetical protein [Cypionkella sp.]MDB5658407.1 hypothetical protein [Cypionkella sp.]
MRLVVRRGRRANTGLLIHVLMFGGLGAIAAKDLLGRDLHGQAVTLTAPFVILAAYGIYVAWRGTVRAVVDDDAIRIVRLFSTDVVAWQDLVGLRQTPQKTMFWLSYLTRGSRRRPFWLTKGQTDVTTYVTMLDMIRERRPDLFEAKTTELGTL